MKREAPTETVTIDKDRYEELCAKAEWLGWLEAAGVDNWEGVSHARYLRDEETRREDHL